MRVLQFIALLLLIAILIIGGYAIWLNYPREPVDYKPFYGNNSYTNLTGRQFYPNMRFPGRKISYSLEQLCDNIKKKAVEDAFSIISDKTILTFYESEEDPEIKIFCSEVVPEPEQEGHFIAGEGGPTEIINTTLFNVIKTGKISLFRPEICDQPKITLHELFHVLGFNHNNNSDSIMYPTTSCQQEIDSSILNEINKIYVINSYPDLSIEEVNASQKGNYLDFGIGIINSGLKDSRNSSLSILSDGKKIKDFDLGEIDIGMRKFLQIKNLRVIGGSDKITFIIETNEDEISKDNNKAELNALS